MQINGFSLVNEEKLGRALNGPGLPNNPAARGVGDGAYIKDEKFFKDGAELEGAELKKLESAILAEYDRLGGLIVRGKDKVKSGSFYDQKGRCPRAKPMVVFIYNVNGKFVEVADGVELPGEVKAAKVLAEAEATVAETAPEKPRKIKRAKEE